jgi:hypothetical protein
MAKYRCPSCGAAHKEAPSTCRLCGYVMDGTVAVPTQGQMPKAVQVQEKKTGTSTMLVIGLVLLLALAAGAVVLHVSSSNKAVDKVFNKLPGQATPSGWKLLTDAEGGYTVQYPPNPQTTSVNFSAADNGQLTGWLGTVGQAPQVDSQLYVVYGKIHAKPGETAADTVARLGKAKMAEDGGFVESKTTTSYQGYPAIKYTINRVKFEGKQGSEEAVIFLKGGDQLYVVEALSRYPDSAGAFAEVLNTLNFNA